MKNWPIRTKFIFHTAAELKSMAMLAQVNFRAGMCQCFSTFHRECVPNKQAVLFRKITRFFILKQWKTNSTSKTKCHLYGQKSINNQSNEYQKNISYNDNVIFWIKSLFASVIFFAHITQCRSWSPTAEDFFILLSSLWNRNKTCSESMAYILISLKLNIIESWSWKTFI